jgi:hypothetical protein
MSVFFPQGRDVRVVLLVARVNARRRREQEALDPVQPASFQHVSINEDVIVSNVG